MFCYQVYLNGTGGFGGLSSFRTESHAEIFIDLLKKVFDGSDPILAVEACDEDYYQSLPSEEGSVKTIVFDIVINYFQDKVCEVEDIVGMALTMKSKDALREKVKKIAEKILEVGPSPYQRCIKYNTMYSGCFTPYFDGKEGALHVLFKDVGLLQHILNGRREAFTMRGKIEKLGMEIYNELYNAIATIYFPPTEECSLPLGTKIIGQDRYRRSYVLVSSNELMSYKKASYTGKVTTDYTYRYQCFKLSENMVMIELYENRKNPYDPDEKRKVRSTYVFDLNTGESLRDNRSRLELPIISIPAGTKFWTDVDERYMTFTFKDDNKVDFNLVSKYKIVDYQDLDYTIECNRLIIRAPRGSLTGDLLASKAEHQHGTYRIELQECNGPPKGTRILVPKYYNFIPPAPPLPTV